MPMEPRSAILREVQSRANDRGVFPLETPFPRERTLIWHGHDVRAFLDFHTQVHGGTLYLHDVGHEDEMDVETDPEEAPFELGFLHDGLFHVLAWGRHPVLESHPRGLFHDVGVHLERPGAQHLPVGVTSDGRTRSLGSFPLS